MCEATPNVQLWQVRFNTKETKSNHEVWIVLAPELGSLIEDFISKYRPLLLCGVDSGHLFLNRKGQPFTDLQMRDLVCSVTHRYTGCRVPPHLFRNAFAHWWCKNKGDLDTLMKTLGHKDPKTSMRYEAACGVSAALERVGELRRQLGAERKAADDPQFAKCRNCGQMQFLNRKHYCGACQHGLFAKAKQVSVKAHLAA